jgi:hypothetical protein
MLILTLGGQSIIGFEARFWRKCGARSISVQCRTGHHRHLHVPCERRDNSPSSGLLREGPCGGTSAANRLDRQVRASLCSLCSRTRRQPKLLLSIQTMNSNAPRARSWAHQLVFDRICSQLIDSMIYEWRYYLLYRRVTRNQKANFTLLCFAEKLSLSMLRLQSFSWLR